MLGNAWFIPAAVVAPLLVLSFLVLVESIHERLRAHKVQSHDKSQQGNGTLSPIHHKHRREGVHT